MMNPTSPVLSEAASTLQRRVMADSPQAEKIVTMLLAGGPGCIRGIVQAFESQGMGYLTASWRGDQNPLSPEPAQVQSALGLQKVSTLATLLKTTPEQVNIILARWLPHIVSAFS